MGNVRAKAWEGYPVCKTMLNDIRLVQHYWIGIEDLNVASGPSNDPRRPKCQPRYKYGQCLGLFMFIVGFQWWVFGRYSWLSYPESSDMTAARPHFKDYQH